MQKFSIANIRLAIDPEVNWAMDSAINFKESKFAFGQPWTIERNSEISVNSAAMLVFDSCGSWAAYSGPDASLTDFVLYNGEGDARKERGRMRIDDRRRVIHLSNSAAALFGFPFDELALLNALSLNRAVLIHSVFATVNGGGYLFCGVSGAGKSTLGGIFERLGIEVLCDERNVIFIEDAQVFAASTPFYGTSEKAYSGVAPLRAIVSLDPHHQGQSITRLDMISATEQIFPTLFLPQYSREKIQNSLDVVDTVLKSVPCYLLNYDKSKTDIVDFLNSELFSQE